MSEHAEELERCVTRNPAATILAVIGTGLAIALCWRALRPEPTARERLVQLLEDLQDRLSDATRPVVRKAGTFASEGADALHGRVRNGEARLDRVMRHGTHRLRKFFS